MAAVVAKQGEDGIGEALGLQAKCVVVSFAKAFFSSTVQEISIYSKVK